MKYTARPSLAARMEATSKPQEVAKWKARLEESRMQP